MANKRELKKYVEALGSAVANEMMVAYYNVEGIDSDAVASAIQTIIGAVAEAKGNCNRRFDRGVKAFADRKEYRRAKGAFFRALFNKIESDFDAKMEAALKTFNGALPEAYRQAQKEAAN